MPVLTQLLLPNVLTSLFYAAILDFQGIFSPTDEFKTNPCAKYLNMCLSCKIHNINQTVIKVFAEYYFKYKKVPENLSKETVFPFPNFLIRKLHFKYNS